jgi:hypothetical protein
MKNSLVSWILRIVPAIILLQTLFFKFSGAEESVYIFTTLGVEPWGRIGSGVMELIAGFLFLTKYYVWGSLISVGIMFGAVMSHILILGYVIMDDGGQLFIMALVALVFSALLVWQQREVIFKLLGFAGK